MRGITAEPVIRLIKLVEAVHHTARLFATGAASKDVNARFRKFAEKIHGTAEQFEFELQTELMRLSARRAAVSDNPNTSERAAFEALLEAYREALASNITAHARAMVTRQFQEMQRAYEEFASTHLAA